ncbi:hypothetical protein [Dyella nitratireducens]|uniref:Uncharacterized protein n=1 Tax=Dyella nitratireducens TaxID=1849580 RepID=A0ABQ1FXY2_9GAMM|nr:hypothetical protein [Dyella nitratireducens]GGA31954.1 hypothetical protein GCM10010981_21360 [Dyella nitratireducens]GLQ42801.1 hypothetical protein GCM10007902_26510 [Dyella nitratireducens]
MRVVHSVLWLGTLCLVSASAMAQTDAPAQAQASSSCVDVSVNDHAALSYACLNQRLAASTRPAPQPQIQLDAVTQLPSNQQVGQFNFSAFSHQMGSNLGKSVTPWRPPPLQPLPLFGVPVGAH